MSPETLQERDRAQPLRPRQVHEGQWVRRRQSGPYGRDDDDECTVLLGTGRLCPGLFGTGSPPWLGAPEAPYPPPQPTFHPSCSQNNPARRAWFCTPCTRCPMGQPCSTQLSNPSPRPTPGRETAPWCETKPWFHATLGPSFPEFCGHVVQGGQASSH